MGAKGVLSVAGGVVGGIYGGPAGAVAGSAVGGAVGGAIDGPADTGATGSAKDSAALGHAAASDIIGDLNQIRPQQQQFAQQLANQATGQGPSIADAQLKAVMDRNLSQQIAAAKANRAVNPALLNRQVVQQTGQLQAQGAQQSAIDRMQEQRSAQATFANYLAQQRQGAIGYMGGGNQALGIQASSGQADRARQDSINSGLLNAGASYFAQGGGSGGSSGGSGTTSSGNYTKPNNDMFGGETFLPAAGGGIVPGKADVHGDSVLNDKVPALLSPEEVVVPKTVVQKGGKAAAEFVEQVKKQNISIGDNNPQPAAGFGAILAAQAHLDKRMQELEKKYGKKG